MADFSRNLPQPQDFNAGIINPAVSDAPAMLARAANTGIKAGVVANQVAQDSATLTAFARANEQIESKEQRYMQQVHGIIDAAKTAKDKKTLQKFNQELTRLQNGVNQNVLSPMKAEIRRKKLLADYAAEHGHLSSDFYRITRAHMGAVDLAGGSSDPLSSHSDELALQAVETGIPYNVLVQAEANKLHAGILKVQAQMAAYRGTLTAPKFIAAFNGYLHGVANDAYGLMAKAAKSGNFNLPEIKGVLEKYKAQAYNELNQRISALSTDASGHTVMTFTAEQRNAAEETVANTFAGLEAVAESKDPLALMKRLNSLAAQKDIAVAHQVMGNMAVAKQAMPSAQYERLALDVPMYLSQLVHGRTLQSILDRAETRDQDAQLFKDAIDSGWLYNWSLVKQLLEQYHGKQLQPTNPYVRKLFAAAHMKLASYPATTQEAKDAGVTHYVAGLHSDVGQAIATLNVDPALKAKVKSDDKMQQATKNEFYSYATNGVRNLISSKADSWFGSASDLQLIEYDPTNTDAPFSYPQDNKDVMRRNPPLPIPYQVNGHMEYAGNRFIAQLNEFHSLLSSFMDAAQVQKLEEAATKQMNAQILRVKKGLPDTQVLTFNKEGKLVPVSEAQAGE